MNVGKMLWQHDSIINVVVQGYSTTTDSIPFPMIGAESQEIGGIIENRIERLSNGYSYDAKTDC